MTPLILPTFMPASCCRALLFVVLFMPMRHARETCHAVDVCLMAVAQQDAHAYPLAMPTPGVRYRPIFVSGRTTLAFARPRLPDALRYRDVAGVCSPPADAMPQRCSRYAAPPAYRFGGDYVCRAILSHPARASAPPEGRVSQGEGRTGRHVELSNQVGQFRIGS